MDRDETATDPLGRRIPVGHETGLCQTKRGSWENDPTPRLICQGPRLRRQGTPEAGTEGALQYLSTTAAHSQPFFMVISLVNPHYVLFYPRNYVDGGYDESWLRGEIGLPATANEDLSTKPTVQEEFLKLFNASGSIPTPQMKRNYVNFYGNLMKSSRLTRSSA